MRHIYQTWRSTWLAWAVVVALVPVLAFAADRKAKPKYGEFNPDDQTVEMFQAMDAGQIDVTLIPKNSKQCRVMIENKSDKPLNVRLPEAFAGVPVLAQMGGMGGMGGGGGGGGFFNVPPEKVAKFKVATVCLEHGKNEPRPKMKYVIKPLDQFTKKEGVYDLCRMMGTGKMNQRAAQVAAWHLNNDMSWQKLAAKTLHYANGTSKPYFTAQEIQAGMQIAQAASQLAKQREQQSPTKSNSVSQN